LQSVENQGFLRFYYAEKATLKPPKRYLKQQTVENQALDEIFSVFTV
jgi:hypothetical protein